MNRIPTHRPFWRNGYARAFYWIIICTLLGALVGAA